MIRVSVYRINNPSVKIAMKELESKSIGTYLAFGCRGSDLKRWVAKKTGVPPKRQVYHLAAMDRLEPIYRLSPMEVISDCCLSGSCQVAVQFLPENPEAADDDDEEEIQVVREANALDERPPRPKRPRTATGTNDGKARSDAEEDDSSPSTAARREAKDAGHDAGKERAAATAAEATAGRGCDASVPSSALRRWLRDLDRDVAEGDDDDNGRFEAFAPAFEREFRSLADLAFAADRLGVAEVMAACGVERCGDRARLDWAIGKLERPR